MVTARVINSHVTGDDCSRISRYAQLLGLRRLHTAFVDAILVFLALLSIQCGDGPTESQTETYQLHGVNFGPYLKGQDPANGIPVPVSQLDSLIGIVAPHTRWIRTFGSTNGLQDAGRIAHEQGLKAACGAWLSRDMQANETEISNLIEAAINGWVDLAIVGSETLTRGDLTEGELLEYIDRVQLAIPDSVPVTTADVDDVLLKHPNVTSAVDIVFANFYPFWAGIGIEHAVAAVHASRQRLIHVSGGKQVVVSETGWPSCGVSIGNAVPSPENAGQYFVNVVSWARANDVEVFYFEAFDERWKALHEGPQGACWGIWDEDGNMKSWMLDTFQGATISDNWTDDDVPGGEGRPAIVFTDVPRLGTHDDLRGQVWHVEPFDHKVAVYILVRGRWWIKPYFNRPLTTISPDGSWITDVTTGGIDEQATGFLAFLLPNGVEPPLAGGWSSLPQSIYDVALAIIEIRRYQ